MPIEIGYESWSNGYGWLPSQHSSFTTNGGFNLQAANRLAITNADVAVTGDLQGSGQNAVFLSHSKLSANNIALNTSDRLSNNGDLIAQQNIQLNADSIISTAGSLKSQTGEINLQATHDIVLQNNSLQSPAQLTLKSSQGDVRIDQSQLQSGDFNLWSGGYVYLNGNQIRGNNLNFYSVMRTEFGYNRWEGWTWIPVQRNELNASGNINLQSDNHLFATDVWLTAQGNINVIATHDLYLNAGNMQAQNISLNSQGILTNNQDLSAVQNIQLTATQMSLMEGHRFTSQTGDIQLNSPQGFTLNQYQLTAGGNVHLQAEQGDLVVNQSQIQSGQDTTLTATTLSLDKVKLNSVGTLELQSKQGLDTTNYGMGLNANELQVNAGDIQFNSGSHLLLRNSQLNSVYAEDPWVESGQISLSSVGNLQVVGSQFQADDSVNLLSHQGSLTVGSSQIKTWHAIFTADNHLDVNTGSRVQAEVVNLATVKGDIGLAGDMQPSQLLMASAGGNLRVDSQLKPEQLSTVILSANQNMEINAPVNLEPTGSNISLSAQNIRIANDVHADGLIQMTAEQNIHAMPSFTMRSVNSDINLQAGRGMVLWTGLNAMNVQVETGEVFGDVTGATPGYLFVYAPIQAQQNMSLISSGQLSFQGTPGSMLLKSGGNMLLQSGQSWDNTGVNLQAGGNLRIKAAEQATLSETLQAGGHLDIEAGQVSVREGVNLSANGDLTIAAEIGQLSFSRNVLKAGGDLNLNIAQGNLELNHSQAQGKNIHLVAQSELKLFDSTLTAEQDIQIQNLANRAISLTDNTVQAGGKLGIQSEGELNLISGARPNQLQAHNIELKAQSISSQGSQMQTTEGGNLVLNATGGNVNLSLGNQLNASGNLVLNARDNLMINQLNASAGDNMTLSSTFLLNSENSHLQATNFMSFVSSGVQNHLNARYQSGALLLKNDLPGMLGMMAINQSQLETSATQSPATQALSGQLNIHSGGQLFTQNSRFSAGTDLSISQGTGDITLNFDGSNSLGDLSAQRDLSLVARQGSINLTGSEGSQGRGSSQYVNLNVAGNLTLQGVALNLAGSHLKAGGDLNLIASSGDIDIHANRVSAVELGGYARSQSAQTVCPVIWVEEGNGCTTQVVDLQQPNYVTNTYWDNAQLSAGKMLRIQAKGDGNISINGLNADAQDIALLSEKNIQCGTYSSSFKT